MSSDVVHVLRVVFFASGFLIASDDIHSLGVHRSDKNIKEGWTEVEGEISAMEEERVWQRQFSARSGPLDALLQSRRSQGAVVWAYLC